MRVKKWALMGILCGTMVLLAGCGKAQKAYKQAVALAENGSYEKAAASFKEAIAENKDKAEYYIDYGMTLNHLGSYKKAIKQFEKAYQKVDNKISRQNNKRLYYGEALAYYGIHEYDKAKKQCDKALEISESKVLNGDIYATLAMAQWASGDSLGALGALDQLIKENAKENKIYSKESDENANIHHIKMSDGQEVILVEDIYNQNQFNIDGMKTYMYNVIGKEGKAKVVYLDEDLDFDMINKDDKYAYIVRDFLSPARIERLSSQEAKGKGVVDFLYVGNIQKDQESEIGYKRIRYTDDYIYNKISKKEYEFESKNKKELENNIEKYGEDKSSSFVNGVLANIVKE